MGNPYDAIPAGKKAEYNIKLNQWEIVDLEVNKAEDLRILHNEAKAQIANLKGQVTKLKNEVKALKEK